MRTDFNRREDVILPSLDEGLLRQGWGYRDDQDLAIIGPVVYEDGRAALNEDQKLTWTRVQRFWPEHWEPVEQGDLILLPKVPTWGHWRLVRVTGDYYFQRHPASGDHGHILPIEVVVSDIDATNAAVKAPLQRTMRTRSPMWNIDGLAQYVEDLVEAGASAAAPDEPTKRLEGILDDTREYLLPRIRREFQANQLEGPVFRLLGYMFPDALVEKKAGPNERGADFTVTESNAFGHERVTVVQLKDYPEVLNGTAALEQIRTAFNVYAPVAAVILTTAQRMEPEFERGRQELEEELNIPVTVILGLQLASWFLTHLDAVAAD